MLRRYEFTVIGKPSLLKEWCPFDEKYYNIHNPDTLLEIVASNYSSAENRAKSYNPGYKIELNRTLPV